MKWHLLLIVFLILTGCGEKKPASVEAVPLTSIEQQNREIAQRLEAQKAANEAKALQEAEIADKQRMIRVVQEQVSRWLAAYSNIIGKKANELDEAIAQMQAARSELNAAATSACTELKRNAIVNNMDRVASLLAEFKAANGNMNAEFGTRLGEAVNSVSDAAGTIATCQ
jgi:hypothetical protein